MLPFASVVKIGALDLGIASDLGMPTGVLAQLAMADALGTAHTLRTNKLIHSVQIINGLKPELRSRALDGEHVGSIVHSRAPCTVVWYDDVEST